MMLSVLMRYIIYDAKAPRVPLKKELSHISNFIDLQKIRLSEMVKNRLPDQWQSQRYYD